MIKAYLARRPHVVEEGIDKTGIQLEIKQMQQQFPKEYQLLEKHLENQLAILDAIFKSKSPLRFKKSATFADRANVQAAADNIKKNLISYMTDIKVNSTLLEDVLYNSAQGKSTIFDFLKIDAIFQHCLSKNVHLPLRVALVYCPFHELSERIAIRNKEAKEKGNPSEERIGISPLLNFAELFGPKQSENDLVLETLNRNVVIADFKKNFNDRIEASKPEEVSQWISFLKKQYGDLSDEELIRKEEEKTLNSLLNQLGFTSDEVQNVEITPRMQNYHYLLDTSRLTAEQAADILDKDVKPYHIV